jgi:phosphopantothenoylcysteine decarboxylase / phosphopantothenate---cysteine ligase
MTDTRRLTDRATAGRSAHPTRHLGRHRGVQDARTCAPFARHRRRSPGRHDGECPSVRRRRRRSRPFPAVRCATIYGTSRPKPRWDISSSRAGPTCCWSPRLPPTRLSRLAAGRADDLLTTLRLATRAPLVVAPAMNHVDVGASGDPAQSRDTRRRRLPRCSGPISGAQACGEFGPGRMVEPGAICAAVIARLGTSASTGGARGSPARDRSTGRHVIVTAGPTREAIDPVRYISNHSSGKQGYAMAAARWQPAARGSLSSADRSTSRSARERGAGSRHERHRDARGRSGTVSSDCDIFIGVAAVADYRPGTQAQERSRRPRRTAVRMTLELVENPDIIAQRRPPSPQPFVVGFRCRNPRSAQSRPRQKNPQADMDMIVVNDVSRTDIGFNTDVNDVTVIWAAGEERCRKAARPIAMAHSRACDSPICRPVSVGQPRIPWQNKPSFDQAPAKRRSHRYRAPPGRVPACRAIRTSQHGNSRLEDTQLKGSGCRSGFEARRGPLDLLHTGRPGGHRSHCTADWPDALEAAAGRRRRARGTVTRNPRPAPTRPSSTGASWNCGAGSAPPRQRRRSAPHCSSGDADGVARSGGAARVGARIRAAGGGLPARRHATRRGPDGAPVPCRARRGPARRSRRLRRPRGRARRRSQGDLRSAAGRGGRPRDRGGVRDHRRGLLPRSARELRHRQRRAQSGAGLRPDPRPARARLGQKATRRPRHSASRSRHRTGH